VGLFYSVFTCLLTPRAGAGLTELLLPSVAGARHSAAASPRVLSPAETLVLEVSAAGDTDGRLVSGVGRTTVDVVKSRMLW